jgi:hypothetical protein
MEYPVPQRRTLIHFPIVHSAEDLGGLADATKQTRADDAAHARHEKAVAAIWDHIEQAVKALPVASRGWRVYQDGLPVCGHELEIVNQLATAGSRNYRLVKSLVARGAALMGTELGELLVEEYSLQKEMLEQGRDSDETRELAASLLARRDHFIARRIDDTLRPGETGILFLGMVHGLDEHLPDDIDVRHPIGKPSVSVRQS